MQMTKYAKITVSGNTKKEIEEQFKMLKCYCDMTVEYIKEVEYIKLEVLKCMIDFMEKSEHGVEEECMCSTCVINRLKEYNKKI